MFKTAFAMAAVAAVTLDGQSTISDLAYDIDVQYLQTEMESEKHWAEHARERKLNLAIKKMKKSIKDHDKHHHSHSQKTEKKEVKKVVYRPHHNKYEKVTKLPASSHHTRKSEHKDWPSHRHHFTNNYKNLPPKLEDRSSMFKKMMNNWNSNQYAQVDSDASDYMRGLY